MTCQELVKRLNEAVTASWREVSPRLSQNNYIISVCYLADQDMVDATLTEAFGDLYSPGTLKVIVNFAGGEESDLEYIFRDQPMRPQFNIVDPALIDEEKYDLMYILREVFAQDVPNPTIVMEQKAVAGDSVDGEVLHFPGCDCEHE